MKIIKEFKDFATRGNVVDLAIGVVIGASFNSITNSLVSDIINPILGILTNKVDLSEQVFVLQDAGASSTAVVIGYGNFLSNILNFLIIAFVLFLVIKQVNKLTR
ncbi:MAG: large conductance mechanosensitive channel [Patescibacteria group bacterium]|nr:large conductance mechanosensitive channel [Patescibacteria group bacterium]MDQ5957885.1 large conductance mechanosensitive channel [Patescibacteria group bacterium]